MNDRAAGKDDALEFGFALLRRAGRLSADGEASVECATGGTVGPGNKERVATMRLRQTIYSALRPLASLLGEDRYLRCLAWASRRCRPACRPLLVLYCASVRFQLSPEEIMAVLPHLQGARRFLVFGLGRDSKLWQVLGPGETHFVEHDQDWIDAVGSGHQVHPVVYTTKVEDGLAPDTTSSTAAGGSSELDLDLPAEVLDREWDVVLVDGPPGYEAGRPGRLQSIRSAARLVRPGGVVAVHDMDRELEQRASKRWLGEPDRRRGRLGVFRATWNEAPPFEGGVTTGDAPFEPGGRPFMDPERISCWYRDDHVEITVVNFEEGLRFGPRHDREILLVRDPWYPDAVVPSVLRDKLLNRAPRGQVFYLSNTEQIHRARRAVGLDSHFVNIGALIDASDFIPVEGEKRYHAAMISRFSWFAGDQLKRHDLAREVPSLALLDPMFGSVSSYYREHYAGMPNCRFINESRLPPEEVASLLGQSHCGLILSSIEGVCRASSEYLLSGLPVVSTPSTGGRDVWYDDENSIVVEPDPKAVAAAVESLVRNPRDPQSIRAGYLERARVFRERLVTDVLEPVMHRFGAACSAREVVETIPFPWWPEPQTGSDREPS